MTGTVNIAPAGDHALLIELDRTIAAAELHGAAQQVRALEGVLACIVGHSSLYVVFRESSSIERFLPFDLVGTRAAACPPHSRTLAVCFRDEYGPDLSGFLTHAHITRDEFLARIRDLRLVVRYLGFRGGFAYLDGWPPEWAMPRRPTSRPVARGSFGIAGGVAGFYPIDSPGGWNILGRTAEPIEYRFAAGDEILISPVENLPPSEQTRVSVPHFPGISAPFMTRVGGANWANLERGIPVGGPFDIEAAEAANIAAGNAPGAELLEFAQIGPRITPDSDVLVAWYDAGGGTIHRLRARETLDLGRINNGLRGYLAIAAERGGAPLKTLRRTDRLVIRAMRGPHDIGLDEIECEVTPSLDRAGVRLRPLRKIDVKPPADLPSIGMQFGSLQLHPDGSIVAMGPEHPVTGGYLQPMTVLWPERWKLAHLAPGERVRFIAHSP